MERTILSLNTLIFTLKVLILYLHIKRGTNETIQQNLKQKGRIF